MVERTTHAKLEQNGHYTFLVFLLTQLHKVMILSLSFYRNKCKLVELLLRSECMCYCVGFNMVPEFYLYSISFRSYTQRHRVFNLNSPCIK
jgi:hypothetical protein